MICFFAKNDFLITFGAFADIQFCFRHDNQTSRSDLKHMFKTNAK